MNLFHKRTEEIRGKERDWREMTERTGVCGKFWVQSQAELNTNTHIKAQLTSVQSAHWLFKVNGTDMDCTEASAVKFLCRSSLFFPSNSLKSTLVRFGQISCHISFRDLFFVRSPFTVHCILPFPSSCTYILSPNPHITSCLLAPPRSQSAHPQNPSRHPVTSLSQHCHKTCMSFYDNYMVVRAARRAVI